MDDECIHLNDPALCTICNGKDAAGKRTPRTAPKAPVAKRSPATKAPTPATTVRRLTTKVVSPTSLDTPESVEHYRERYSDREETFDAYVLVFFNTDARSFPGGWTNFSRCANAEPERKASVPALVARAERIMRDAGYEADDSGRPQKGRRWFMDD